MLYNFRQQFLDVEGHDVLAVFDTRRVEACTGTMIVCSTVLLCTQYHGHRQNRTQGYTASRSMRVRLIGR
jgi:hypothetical protein